MSERVVAVLGRGIVDPNEAVVRADDLGLSRGDGCFETCRVLSNPASPGGGSNEVLNLDAHLHRLRRSLDLMGIDADVDECGALVRLAAAAWTAPGEAAVKLMVTRGVEGSGIPSVIATVSAISPTSLAQRESGVRVVTLSRGTSATAFDAGDWLLGGVKSLSYAFNLAALREAAERGADDVVWISTDGYVLEAPTATVVWAVPPTETSARPMLRTTPAGASGILAGTTMAALFGGASGDGFDTGTAQLLAAGLSDVAGLWLVSSVRGVVEVVEIDGRGRPRHPELTARLQKLAGF